MESLIINFRRNGCLRWSSAKRSPRVSWDKMVPYTRISRNWSPRVRADQADAEGWAETSRQIWTNCVAGEMAGHRLEVIDACAFFRIK